jgi:3-hydroxyisobutyrate dehydrogenase-like beta-hydroxyacid dehydrogenase
MIKTISYLGLGTMGSGMASNLLKAGYELTVWNRSAEKCEPFARKGARIADSPRDAVRDVDLVMYSLSNDQAIEEVVFGAKGILTGINEGQIAIDMSTVLPAMSSREQEAYAKHGVGFLDAPVFGSKQEAADAKLWIMAAGKKAIFEKAKPVLEHLGQTVHYLGKNGNAAAMKLVGNLIVALEMEALAEGLVLAQKAGLDLKTVMEVVKVADFRSPLLVSNGQNILNRDFSTSFALKLMLKDAGLIEKLAESLRSPIPALRVAERNLESAVDLGFGTENASALIKALEKEAGVEVKAGQNLLGEAASQKRERPSSPTGERKIPPTRNSSLSIAERNSRYESELL